MVRGEYIRRQTRNEEIQFVNDEWRASFARHTMMARKMPFYRPRIEFATLWMKEMQLQMRVGVLDPDTSFRRVTWRMRYQPSLDDIIFMRGVIGSHWKHGEYFLHYTSGGFRENLSEELKNLRQRYFLSAEALRDR